MKTKEQINRKIEKTKKELEKMTKAKNQKEAYLVGELCGKLDALLWARN